MRTPSSGSRTIDAGDGGPAVMAAGSFVNAVGAAASEADLALCRSALWEALALGFRPPADETVARLACASGARALADAAALLDAAGGGGLVERVLALGEVTGPTREGLESAYVRVFGHTARGPVPPYETEYGEDSPFQPQREMSDLSAFFRAFGLAMRPDAHERPDHAACECEFMVVLARKECHALETGDEGMLQATREAARLFLRDHLGRWAPTLGTRLAREDPAGFYGRLGDLCAAFVAAECRRARVPVGPELLRLRPAETSDAPMACGTVEDTVAT